MRREEEEVVGWGRGRVGVVKVDVDAEVVVVRGL